MTVVDLAPAPECTEDEAEALAARTMAAYADVTGRLAIFLDFVGEFDATNAIRFWAGIDSTAHWVAWACSIAPGTSREYVRVARALRQMPHTRARFAAGELTYSKVREMTRLVDRVAEPARPAAESSDEPDHPADDDHQAAEHDQLDSDAQGVELEPDWHAQPDREARLVDLARRATASQLARSITGYRAADGSAKRQRSKQQVSWWTDEDGNLHLSAVLPAEEGAAVVTAIQAAVDANRPFESELGDEQPDDDRPEDSCADDTRSATAQRTRIGALYELATHYLGTRPEDRSGEDRTLVVLEINASALEADSDDHGPGSKASLPTAAFIRPDSVPAGTPTPTCRVRGSGAIDTSGAHRALCDQRVLGVIISDLGEPLAVGRTQRLVTRAQRRALMIRDGCCQYPGCTRIRRLQAHHRISWLGGGPTDLENLILLCKWHHTVVHENKITITSCDQPTCTIRWRFSRPDHTMIIPSIAGIGARSPWRPLVDAEGRALTGSALEAASKERDRQVRDHQAEQTALRHQQEEVRGRYGHIGHGDHPDAHRIFPVGGGAGFDLAACIDALFSITKHATAQAA